MAPYAALIGPSRSGCSWRCRLSATVPRIIPPFLLDEDVLAEMTKFANCKDKDTSLPAAVTVTHKPTRFINQDSSMRTLLALDGASALLDALGPGKKLFLFCTFRRTIRMIPPGMGLFTILVDTSSGLANFSFSSKFDPSARQDFEGRDRLYAPIYEIASFDAMVPSNSPQSWEELASPQRLFKHGSPTFGAYFRDATTKHAKRQYVHATILEIACFKLFGPTEYTRPGSLTEAQARALLGPAI
ncbi:hypothetical protein Pst134EB_030077 [Puccinia striiformis f. sp. tritici]|nr:hypothetical protein Pst134EB_030077 [Puccinia striiformis f. sp. tritici]